MIRRCIDVLAFAGLVAIGCVWSVTAFGQNISVGPSTGTGYPTGATSVVGASTGTTGAVAPSIGAGVGSGRLVFLCGFSISTLEGVTAATTAPTVSNLAFFGTFTYQVTNTASVANTFTQTFSPCLPAVAVNQSITVTSPANATASAVDVNVWGYSAPVN